MAKLSFTKMHGCGNDYIYVIADRVRPANPGELSRRLSDRRFGIGGDGLIMLAPSKGADVRMEMYNADGSRGEMCGNGIRCVARLHYARAARPRNPMLIETDCGLKSVQLKLDGGRVSEATVDMGEP
ncbi:MAG: diaminopimelate epimerase, partial [Candidatus Binataceae bacterium]